MKRFVLLLLLLTPMMAGAATEDWAKMGMDKWRENTYYLGRHTIVRDKDGLTYFWAKVIPVKAEGNYKYGMLRWATDCSSNTLATAAIRIAERDGKVLKTINMPKPYVFEAVPFSLVEGNFYRAVCSGH